MSGKLVLFEQILSTIIERMGLNNLYCFRHIKLFQTFLTGQPTAVALEEEVDLVVEIIDQ